jgi:hypothetical protein
VQKIFDKFFTGIVLVCLVSAAYFSYYLRPWRWLPPRSNSAEIPDDPFAQIPLPNSTDKRNSEKAEKAVV